MDNYAVIGNPVAHSKSPQIHAAFARATGQDMSYERLLAPREDLWPRSTASPRAGGQGLNVTVPFKLDAFALAVAHCARARRAGAVNTLSPPGDGWFGDNTDGAGIVRDLTVNLGVAIAGRDVLVLGAGGATRGIMVPLLAQRPRALASATARPPRRSRSRAFFAAHGPDRRRAAGCAGRTQLRPGDQRDQRRGSRPAPHAVAVAGDGVRARRVCLRPGLRRRADPLHALGDGRAAPREPSTAWAC